MPDLDDELEHVIVERTEPRGMIQLRGDLGSRGMKAACKAVGVGVPGRLEARMDGGRGVLWMSPDELMLLTEREAVAGTLGKIAEALSGEHHLAVDMSDARAIFRLTGPGTRETLAKLTPADLRPASFGEGIVRRTRLAQVSAAFWLTGPETMEVICFRSVADYVERLLQTASMPGGRVRYW